MIRQIYVAVLCGILSVTNAGGQCAMAAQRMIPLVVSDSDDGLQVQPSIDGITMGPITMDGIIIDEYREITRRIFIGDSRTVAMCDTVTGANFSGEEYIDWQAPDGDCWICHGGIGYAYLRDTAYDAVDKYLQPGAAVIIMLGINDDVDGSYYAQIANNMAQKAQAYGAYVYYVSINPVVESSYAATYYHRTNALLSEKNKRIQDCLSAQVRYIDTYSHIIDTFSAPDGIHYTADTTWAIYRQICLDVK